MTIAKVKPALQEQALQYADPDNEGLVQELMQMKSKELIKWMDQQKAVAKDRVAEDDDTYNGINRFSAFRK